MHAAKQLALKVKTDGHVRYSQNSTIMNINSLLSYPLLVLSQSIYQDKKYLETYPPITPKGTHLVRFCESLYVFIHSSLKELPVRLLTVKLIQHKHSQDTLLGTLCNPCFCFQKCLISFSHRFNKHWKHSSQILIHIDMIASRGCCKFVG